MPGSTVTLNGREYLVDYGSDLYKRASIPLLRRQSDSSSRPGEQSINPEGPWRRTQESWHHGDGQDYADRDDSDPSRYGTSTGLDPWDRWSLTLLSDTVLCYTPTISVTNSLVVGDRVYIVDGTAVKYTTALSGASSWTTVTGLVGLDNIKLCTDGAYVYIPQGASGLYRVANNATAAAAYCATATGKESFYVLGRLIVTDTTTISNVVDAATVELLATLGSGRWSDVTEGRGFIFAAASTQSAANLIGTGDGTIYRIGILADGSGLDVPAVAARLPPGEDALTVFGYPGYLLIGTSQGVRFAQENSDGTLTLGALRDNVSFANSVTNGFTARGRFVYCCASAAGAEAGLARLDLSEFVAPLTPAGAPDIVPPAGALLTGATNSITTCGTFSGLQFFAVSGSAVGLGGGLYVAIGARRPSGVLTTGTIDYGLSESKMPLFVDVQTEPLPSGASVVIALSVDGGSYTTVGTHDVDGASSFTADLASAIGSNDCRFFQVKLTLTATGTAPVVHRATLRAYPVTARGETIQLPFILAEREVIDGYESAVDISAEISATRTLVSAKSLVDLVEGDITTKVYVEDFQFNPHHATRDGNDSNGVLVVKLKTFSA